MARITEAIVLYPSPGVGHLISMIELGKLLLHGDPSLSIHILITTPPFEPPYFPPPLPSITFHHLPVISIDKLNRKNTILSQILHLLRLNNPNIRKTLSTISAETLITALVLDFFCIPALDIALEIPCHLFSTSSASCLALLLHLPTLHERTSKSFKDMVTGGEFNVPGLPALVAADMPQPLQDRMSHEYSYFLEYSRKLPKLDGFIVNSFDRLEEKALMALKKGLLLPHGVASPPVYCVGPLVAWDKRSQKYGHVDDDGNGDKAEYLTWLDSQPAASVVFLCFGSLGFVSTKQLHEIAMGLEKSGQRFLWFIRRNNVYNNNDSLDSLSTTLPEGFLQRTRSKGRVLDTWAPQIAILNHDSVGGFVTHCGWNSILEAVTAGVPMVAWPLYAEQRLNKVVLVEEMKVALPVESSDLKDEDGGLLISRVEVAKKVKELMEGKEVREKAVAMREEARFAAGDNGSSYASLMKIVDSLKKKRKAQFYK